MSFNLNAGIPIMAAFNVYCWDDGNEDKPEVYPIHAATAEEAERLVSEQAPEFEHYEAYPAQGWRS